MRFGLDYEWRAVGRVEIGTDGKIRFPVLPIEPGVYQLDFKSGPDSVLYIGESDNLRRRGQNYRTPGPSQRTSKRINAKLLQHLGADGVVQMVITTKAQIEIAGEWGDLDLSIKAARLLVESSALLLARKNTIPVENL